jgi:hypothetical protein
VGDHGRAGRQGSLKLGPHRPRTLACVL